MKQGQFSTYFNEPKNKLATSRSGQALIEYVLLLFVSIVLLMGARMMMVGIKDFMEGYMGKYVRCLMDYGELPTRGIDVDELKKNEMGNYNCAKQFTFNVKTGFQSNADAGSFTEGNGGSGSSSSSSKAQNSNSKSESDSDPDKSNSDGTTSGASLSDVASRERNRRTRGPTAASDSASGNELSSAKASRLRSVDGEDDSETSSSRIIGEAEPKNASSAADSEMARSGRARYRALSGEMAEQIEKNSKRAQTNSKSKTAAPVVLSEEEGRLGPRKSSVALFERKPQQVEEEVEAPFSFGNVFKYVIIIALVIMIVIFFGGQILNYSKSDN